MTRAEIQAFLAVMEYGSISGAADKLFLRQSTVSERIRALEAELNVTLFRRGKGVRSAELTPAGRDFVPLAEKWERLWLETLASAGRKQHRTLSICAISSINAYIMQEVYGLFTARSPNVPLRLLIRHSDETYHLMESGGAEAAFVTKPHFSKKVQTLPLFRESMQLACNEAYRISEPARPPELDAGREILLDWHREYGQWHEYWFGANCTPRVYTDDMGMMESFLKRESCWAVVPLSAARVLAGSERIRIRSLTDGPQDRTVYMLLPNAAGISEELHLLLGQMQEVTGRLGASWIFA